MKSLIRYLTHLPTWQKLPPLPRMYSSAYDLARVDHETQTLMRLTHTRCPQGVEVLKRRYGAKTSQQLIEQLPARRRRRKVGARLLALYRRAFGLLPHNPMKREYRERR